MTFRLIAITAMLAVTILTASCHAVRGTLTCSARSDEISVTRDNVHPFLRTKTIRDTFGVQLHQHEVTWEDIVHMRKLSPGYIRIDLDWSGTERHKGSYDWEHLDIWAHVADQMGAKIIVTLNYGNDLYEGKYPWKTEDAWSGFSAIVVEAMKRYEGKEVIWEVWNEPTKRYFWPDSGASPREYFDFCVRLSALIRERNPASCIIGPASPGYGHKWQEELYSLGFLHVVDGISVHPYRNGAPETALEDDRRLFASMCRSGGPMLPIIYGEWGYGSHDGDVGMEMAKLYAERMTLVAASVGRVGPVWYDWRGGGKNTFLDDVTLETTDLFDHIDRFLDEHGHMSVSEVVSSGDSWGVILSLYDEPRIITTWSVFGQGAVTYKGVTYQATPRPAYNPL